MKTEKVLLCCILHSIFDDFKSKPYQLGVTSLMPNLGLEG